MTIKEFARLCGCNPQSLRYYDHVNLLKPVKVDQWSGYRFYEEEQALAFVKIKNLQKAGFTIEEIKELLGKDNLVIYKAFDAKIAEEEKRLQEIKAIQKSYQTEMTDMKKKLETMRDMYSQMIESVNGFFESMISRSDDSDFEYSEYSESDESVEELEYVNMLNNPDYEIVYEKHGWSFVKEFFSEFSTLDEGQDYALEFHLCPSKRNHTAFANTVLGMLLNCNPDDLDNKRSLSCNTTDSKDGQNHFWMLKRK